MSIPLNVATVLANHVTLELECIDRMYLNGYVPSLQAEGGVVHFFRQHRGQPFASSALMDPISRTFVGNIERFVATEQVPLVTFEKGQRKDDVAARHLARFDKPEGVLFVGKAQETTWTFRTHKRQNPVTGKTYPWLYRTTTRANQYYFYLVDADFGPLFIKFGSYFPYPVKVCLNGHEYLKRQLAQRGIPFAPLDNGILSCADRRQMQALADGLTAEKIERVFGKWLARLPHPWTPADQDAGYRYDLSILQAEFALTQILDRPETGRRLFEQIIRDNLDLGRPDHVQRLFERRITKRTPGRFRTRVLTQGVSPTLRFDYKHSTGKQYWKEGRGLRNEFTTNDTRDFGIGRRLSNLPALRQIGFQATRRLLDVERLSHDCFLGDAAVAAVIRPTVVEGQRVPALRLGDPRVLAVFSALVLFRLLPAGFTNAELRAHLVALLGMVVAQWPGGRVTYDLRRLRLRGLIARVPHSQRYRVTEQGFRTALFFLKLDARILRPGLAEITPGAPPTASRLQTAFAKVDAAIDRLYADAHIAA